MIGSWRRELPDYSIRQVEQAEYQLPKYPLPKQTKKSLLGNVSDYSRKSWIPFVIILAVILLVRR